jgi:hypothetical protein
MKDENIASSWQKQEEDRIERPSSSSIHFYYSGEAGFASWFSSSNL